MRVVRGVRRAPSSAPGRPVFPAPFTDRTVLSPTECSCLWGHRLIGHVPAGWFPFSCPTAALCWLGFQKAGEGPPAMADAELHLLFPCRPLISKRSRPYHSQWGFAEEVPSGPGTQDLAAALLPPPGGGGGPQEQRLPRSVLGPHLTFQDRERSGPTGRGRPPPEALEGQRLGSEPGLPGEPASPRDAQSDPGPHIPARLFGGPVGSWGPRAGRPPMPPRAPRVPVHALFVQRRRRQT